MARLNPEHMVGAALTTLAWAALFGVLFGGWFTAKMGLVTLISAILHPLIGKGSSWFIQKLCQGIDWCYCLGARWGNWSREKVLWVAVFWPITLPVMLSLCGVGLLFGVMYKVLFAGPS